MGIVGRLNQYASMLAGEFDEITANNTSITGLGTYYSTEFNENIVDIVRNGLVLNLDAGNLASYPGSGTTWTDVSSNGNNGTLVNGTGYNSANGGSLVFDGTNDYVSVANSNSLNPPTNTLICWAKSDTSTWNENGFLMSKRDVFVMHPNAGSTTVDYFYRLNNAWVSQQIPVSNITVWNMYACSWDGTNINAYLNGVLINSGVKTGPLNTSDTGVLEIGKDDTLARYLDGNIAQASIYNRALTAAEIQQNYNALATRFGLSTTNSTAPMVANVFPPYDLVYDDFGGTLFGAGQGRYMRQNTDKSVIVYNEIDEVSDFRDIVRTGLVLDLDAGQPLSYKGTGTVWNDLSGNGQNFTLYNSPTFSSNNGGEILFSGSNDYARIRNSSSIDLLSSNGTVEVWFRTISSTLGVNYARLISFSDETGTGSDTTSTQGTNRDYDNYICLVKNNTAESLGVWYKSNPNAFGPATLVNTNTYFNAVISWSTSGASMTFNFYLNGTNTNTSTVTQSGYSVNASTITIGDNCAAALTSPFENSSCAFSSVRLYNRALTATEITQNYNALKHRFGL